MSSVTGDRVLIDRRLQLGTWAVLALIALRLVVGWHFLEEGVQKVLGGGFSSTGFFRQATGPLASVYQSLLPEPDTRGWLDLDRTKQRWQVYRDKLGRHFDFDQRQEKEADRILAQHVRGIERYFRSHKDDVIQYTKGLEALDQSQADPMNQQIPSLWAHVERNESEIGQLPGEMVSDLRDYWRSLELQLTGTRNEEQAAQGEFPIFPAGGFWSIATIDRVIPYFILIVGVLLLLGLFTRVVSLAGAGFLLMVVSTQPPWIVDAMPVHNYLVELISLLVLAGTGAGRFAGLDFFRPLFRLGRNSKIQKDE